jgi:hypothetical protein
MFPPDTIAWTATCTPAKLDGAKQVAHVHALWLVCRLQSFSKRFISFQINFGFPVDPEEYTPMDPGNGGEGCGDAGAASSGVDK